MAELDEKREAAIRRLKARRGFWSHAFLYAAVNVLLVIVWYIQGGRYFWPGWAMAGWGIGLAMHGWSVFAESEITEDQIQREMQRRP